MGDAGGRVGSGYFGSGAGCVWRAGGKWVLRFRRGLRLARGWEVGTSILVRAASWGRGGGGYFDSGPGCVSRWRVSSVIQVRNDGEPATSGVATISGSS
jgi:hypothetical protein